MESKKQMTKRLSNKTIVVVIVVIVLAALAALSPVFLNPRPQKQGKKNSTAVSKNGEMDRQINAASAKVEDIAEENSDSKTATAEINPNAAGTAHSNAQNQSAPDNDIPVDGSNPSVNTENNSQASDANSAKSPTAAPDNDIKAE